MFRRMFCCFILGTMLTGCTAASQRFASFPTQGQDPSRLGADQAECELIATGKKQDPLSAAISGGLTQGLVSGAAATVGGVILGSMFSSAGQGAKAGLVGLGIGAVLGIVGGIAAADAKYASVYKACMEARNWRLGFDFQIPSAVTATAESTPSES